ncbi:ABC transporter permease [Anaerolineales bacterium HSG24]|nr:ABC transporter permease [Anaerolineales bacterium HSG24]
MARFLIRSFISTVVTMLLVSMLLFFLIDIGGGDVTVKILGIQATPEQRESLRKQLGLDQSTVTRYATWLIGNDWWVPVEYPIISVTNIKTGENEYWADVNGQATRWMMEDGELFALQRQPDGSTVKEPAEVWQNDSKGEIFWGLNNANSAVKWVRGSGEVVFIKTAAGIREEKDGPSQYIPLSKGMLRGDLGRSMRTRRPVAVTLWPRVRNTAILAFVAFVLIMPLALFLGIVAGINEGKPIDRFISVTSLAATATPEFVSGVFLILVLGIWLELVPPVAVFLTDDAIFQNPEMLILPLLTLTLVEVGYVARMTRASMVEVMGAPYIRTAIIKGMPFHRVVIRHAIRNALMAPITVIMLHVNYLVGGLVVVEAIFGYPGLGNYIYDAAIFGDFSAVLAAAMITVIIAIITRLLGDLAYTFLNPRIRYS